MVVRVHSALLEGIDARPCEVEVDVDDRGLQSDVVVGLPDTAVRESMQRVRSAMGNSGYPVPLGKTLINLAPADVRKEGPVYDLPIAAGLLRCLGVVVEGSGEGLDLRRCVVAGELALDGRVRPVRGVIAMADMARRAGRPALIVPAENAAEAAVVPGVDVFGVGSLAELVGLLNGQLELEPTPRVDVEARLAQAQAPIDFREVRGQEAVKRAITVAAAGAHNLLVLCPSDGHRW